MDVVKFSEVTAITYLSSRNGTEKSQIKNVNFTKLIILFICSVGRAEGLRAKQQFFRTRPQDSFVAEGGRAIISCVIGNLGGRVQWTKDGLTLGKIRG